MSEHKQRTGSIWVCHSCNYWFRGLESSPQVACPNGHMMDWGWLTLYAPTKEDNDPLNALFLQSRSDGEPL